MIGIKRLLLLMTPFLIASCVLGAKVETVEIDAMARQLQDSEDMTTPAPKTPTTRKGKGKGSDDEADDEEDSGKGGSSKDSDDDSGKGKGGSSKSGKGKGGKGDDEMTSAPPSSVGGKGDSKSSKKSKSAKSAKSSKSSKSGKGNGGNPGEPTAPSAPPIDITPTTPSPTSVNSIPRRATPYALFYTLAQERIPSTEEYAQLAEVTRVYLEGFMIEEFSQTSLTNLDDFLTFMIRNSFTFGQPAQADYRSTGLFNPSSIFLPTVRELDELITTAFSDDNLVVYLALVRALPSANVFSGTTTISKGLPEVPIPRSSSVKAGDSTMFTAGLASTAAGIVVLAAGLVLLRRQQDADEDEFGESTGKNKGDATVAGETCNMSLDGSSAAASWRNSTKYADDGDDDDLDEDEFEDEPLDDDDRLSMRHSSISRVAT